ncbi:MAG: acetate kinase [Parcubacteria group bacterium LiPW_15]|nr:MAG: acetate kinase [Parcubacteria group bacterium LiPW_15]
MILAVNTGSASKKYALYGSGAEVFRAHLEEENGKHVVGFRFADKEEKNEITEADYKDAVNFILEKAEELKIIKDRKEIERTGVRIVAPGEYFYSHPRINEEYLHKLKEIEEVAPLHITPVLEELDALIDALPETALISVSDGEFHSTLPEVSYAYAIPRDVANKYGIRRFGYHGISIRSVLREAEKLMGEVPEKIIVCHLGSGASITAVKDGKSFDTTMGLTPLEGLVMGTRVGDIDPGALIYLGEKLGLVYEELGDYLNRQCGLLALSGKTADVRELLELESRGDEGAKLALDVFIYRIKKYIGAFAAGMGGVDALIFTATIGERSYIMRERILAGLEVLGLKIDENKNAATVSAQGFIDNGSGARIAVIPADELGEIAKAAEGAVLT